jgi:WD40 repeat protein
LNRPNANKCNSNFFFTQTKVVVACFSPGLKLLVFDQNLILTKTIDAAHTGVINRVKYSPFGNGLVATCSDDYYIKVWDANNQYSQVVNFSSPNLGQVKSLQFLNKSSLITGHSMGYVAIWSITTGSMWSSINIAITLIGCLSRPFRTCFMAAGVNNRIHILNVCNPLQLGFWLPDSHTNSVVDFELTQSDTILISSSEDFTIKVWTLYTSSGLLQFTLTGHTLWVYGLKMISSTVLASGACDNTIKLWNIMTGSLIQTLTGHTNYIIYGIDLFDTNTIISAGRDMTLRLWSSTTGISLKNMSIPCEAQALTVVLPTGN